VSHNSNQTQSGSTPIPPEVATEYVTNSGTAIPALNILNVIGGTGITTEASPDGSNNLIINATGTAFTWNLVTSVSPANPIQILAENGYSCQGSSLVTFILPLAPSFGDTFVILSTTARFQITANAGQQMRVGNVISTAGSGTATSNAAGDYVEMVYVGSNIFQSFAPQGTLTLT
jgi:hypothetical protein